jgi:4-amino-4-deoxy-L-arabinose transferase-like glycosyltransferase
MEISDNRVLLWIACLLLAIQALPYFQNRWVEDESWYSMPAATLVTTGELRNPAMPAFDYESRVDTRPPLMPLSLAVAFRLFGFHVAAARTGEFLAALLSVLVVYGVGRELGDPLAGAIAALMVAADNFMVLAARTARPEAWVTLCASGALLLVLRSHNRHSWKLAFAAGVVAGCACLFHALGLAWVLAFGLVLILQERSQIFRSRRAYAYTAGWALVMLPFVLWLVTSSERMTAAKFMYGRTAGGGLAQILAKEKLRIGDFLGFSNQRLHLPIPLPLRLHIALAIAAAFVVLLRRNPKVFRTLAIVTATYLVWLVRMPNSSSRYYALVAPIFGLACGFALTSLYGTPWRRGAIAVCALSIVTQMGGTALVLNQARKADYPALTEKLRAAIPAGHSCYAAMTFQFALFDRGCFCYDRTPFSYTEQVQKPEYMVLGDRVMMNGSGHGEDDWGELRRQAFAFVERNGELSARIDDPLYGDLRIYRVSYNSPPSPVARP